MVVHKTYILLLIQCLNYATIKMFETNDVQNIQQSNLIAVFDTVPNEYEISFELYLTSFLNQWANVIHFTIYGDSIKYGDRSFSLFFSNNLALISSSINGISNYYIWLPSPFTLMEWNKFFISQILLNGIYNYVIKLNGAVIVTLQNTNPQPFEHVRVYTSNPWYSAQPGYIRNIVVTNVIPMSFFAVSSETILYKGNYLTTIKTVPKEYEITFEAYFTSYLTKTWSDVLRLEGESERFFQISVFESFVYACGSVNGIPSYMKKIDVYNLNEWIKFYVRQSFMNGNYNRVVQINDVIVDSLQNTDAKVFQNVDVFASMNNPQPGILRNLVVINACPICDVTTMLSTNSYDGEIYLLVNITANQECYSYLQNVKVYLQPELLLTLKTFVWNNSSLNDSNVQRNGKSFIVNVGKLTRKLYAVFSVIFNYDESVPYKKSNVSIIADLSWNYFCEDSIIKVKNQKVLSALKYPLSTVNKINQIWKYKQSSTSLLSETYQFVCQTMQKRQSTPCYQREISSGVINFLPIQVMEVFGYNANTTLFYGFTTNNNFIEIDAVKRKPFVITKARCLKVPVCERFFTRK
ncbi:uncharacterized protein LOC105844796 [Hydra vulgaris]|uniref:uncharacterized protein LOC105844796 n=1 Tax=Hydra vulgaris TaxID=6087 RepID=UPI001F5F7975|nr:uncharacterized protein LOC105844796 [Hydra vulgaris]